MKKLFAVLFGVSLIFSLAGMSMACDGPDCYGSGNFYGSAHAGSQALDGGVVTSIYNGYATGEAYGYGSTGGTIGGRVNDGEATADIHVVGGGLAGQTGYTFTVTADRSVGVGSMSHAEGVTEGSLILTSDADYANPFSIYNWFHPNYGVAVGGFSGRAMQNTLDTSYVGSATMDSVGFSTGSASQQSSGQIRGGAEASTYRPSWCSNRPDTAHANAGVIMAGNSGSESYRYINYDGNAKTEGMGTNVYANTNVVTYGDSSRDGYTHGGFEAGGAVNTRTTQGGRGLGSAVAMGNGSYTGAGALNYNYTGSVIGHTSTYVTTVEGLNGSINGAGSSMSVTSHTSTGGIE